MNSDCAVCVRIECTVLTEAFMYHRSYCSKVKEQCSADMIHAEDAFKSSWIYHVKVMMTGFCTFCIERNLVDKMIDLPWDSEEYEHLHKSLFDSAHEMPMKPNDSLLCCLLPSASARNLQLMAASKGMSGQGGDPMSLVKMKGEQTGRVELLLLLEGDRALLVSLKFGCCYTDLL